MSTQLNCSNFATRDNFDAYVTSLLNATKNDLALLYPCKSQICTALWGQGNSDISGIGMIIGYLLEQALGLLLTGACLLAKHHELTRPKLICERSLVSFVDCATFFAFSIEIAALVVLMKEDFGISTSSMGDATVRITQAVSVLVLLPILYAVVPGLSQPLGGAGSESPTAEKDEQKKDSDSKMNAKFGPSRICHSCAITPPEFATVEEMCTTGVATITTAEDALMSAFEILSYIPLSLFVIGRILWLGLEKHHRDSKLCTTLLAWRRKHVASRAQVGWRLCCLAIIPLLACGLLWTVLRTQQFQTQMAKTTSSDDSDAQWTFGQVVAVTVFAPVIVECWSAWQETREQDEGDESDESGEVSVLSDKL